MAEDYKQKLVQKVHREYEEYEAHYDSLNLFEQSKRVTEKEKMQRLVQMLDNSVDALKNQEAKHLWKAKHTLRKLYDSYSSDFVRNYEASVEREEAELKASQASGSVQPTA